LNTPRFRRHLGAFFCIVVWGLSFVVTKQLLNELTPATIALIRFILSSGFLGIYCLLSGNSLKLHAFTLYDFSVFILLGLSGYSLYFWFENTGVGLTTAGNTALIVTTIPLFTELIVSWRSRSFSPQLYFGLVLSLLGVYGLVSGQVQLLEGEHFIGNLFIFIAVFCWVAYSFLIPPVVKKFGILPTTFYSGLCGIFTLLPFLEQEARLIPNHGWTWVIISLLVFLSLICSLLAFILWNQALSDLGEGVTNVYIYLIPVVTLWGEYVFLNQSLEMSKIVSAILIILGVVISQRRLKI
jgi:drug/metabolite transporter (DMT)-like permease